MAARIRDLTARLQTEESQFERWGAEQRELERRLGDAEVASDTAAVKDLTKQLHTNGELLRGGTRRIQAYQRQLERDSAELRSVMARVAPAIRTAYAPLARANVSRQAQLLRELAQAIAEGEDMRNAALAEVRRADRAAGHRAELASLGIPCQTLFNHMGTLRDPNSLVTRWLKEARRQGYEVGDVLDD